MSPSQKRRDEDLHNQQVDHGRIQKSHGISSQVDSVDFDQAIIRHREGDWGEISEEDQFMNARAFSVGGLILGEYLSREGVRFWIISEPDRGETNILLPEEYLWSR